MQERTKVTRLILRAEHLPANRERAPNGRHWRVSKCVRHAHAIAHLGNYALHSRVIIYAALAWGFFTVISENSGIVFHYPSHDVMHWSQPEKAYQNVLDTTGGTEKFSCLLNSVRVQLSPSTRQVVTRMQVTSRRGLDRGGGVAPGINTI